MTGPRLFMWLRPKDGAPPPQEKNEEHLVDPPPDVDTTDNINNENNSDHPGQVEESNQAPDNHTLLSRSTSTTSSTFSKKSKPRLSLDTSHTTLSTLSDPWHYDATPDHPMPVSPDTVPEAHPWYKEASVSKPIRFPLVRPSHNNNNSDEDDTPQVWWTEASTARPQIVSPTSPINVLDEQEYPWYIRATPHRPFKIRSKSKSVGTPEAHNNHEEEEEEEDDDDRTVVSASRSEPAPVRVAAKRSMHAFGVMVRDTLGHGAETVACAPTDLECVIPIASGVLETVVDSMVVVETVVCTATEQGLRCVMPFASGLRETVEDMTAETSACTATEQDVQCVIPIASGVQQTVIDSVIVAETVACTATEHDLQCVTPIASGVQETVKDTAGHSAETLTCTATDLECVIPIASGVQQTVMDSMEVAETVASATTEQEAQCVIPVVSGTVTHDTACIGHTTSEPMELGKTCTVEPVWPIKVTNATEELHPAATVSVIVAAQEVGLDSVVPMTSIRSGAPMTSCIAGATLESCTATVTKTMHPSHDVTSMQSATDSTHLKLLFPLAEAAQAQTVNVPTGTATPVPKQPREENHSTIDTLFPITIGTSTLTHLAPGTAEPLSLHPPVSLTHIGPTALGTLHNLEESALTTSSASLSSCETDLTYIFPFLQGIQCDAHTPIAAAQAVPVTSSTLQCFAPFVPLLSPISEISDIHETGTCTTLAGSPMWTERTDGSDTGYMVGNAEEEELRRRVLEGLDGIQWVRSEKRVERLSKLQSGVERQEDADMDVIEWYREKANDEDGILRLSPVREDDARSFHVSIAVPPSRPHGDGSENLMVSIPSSSETTETSAAGEASASRSPEEPSSSDRKRPRPSFSSARSDMAVVDGHFSAPSQNRHAHTLVASSAEDHHHHSVPVQSTTTTTTTQLNPLPEDAVHFQDDSAHPIPPTFTSLTALGPVRRPWLARSVTRDTVASSCFTSDMSATGDASAVDSGVGDLSVVNDDGVMVMGKGKDLLPYDVQGSLTTFLAMDKGVRAVEVYRVECLTPGSVGVAKTIYGGDKAMENNLGGMYEPIKEEQYDKGGRVRKTSGTGGDTPSVDPPLGMTVEEVETPFEGEDRERVSIAGMTGIVLAQLAYLLLVLSATGHRGVIGTVIGMGSACLWTWVGSWNRRTRDKLLMGCLMWMMAWCAAGAGVGSGEVGDAMMGVAGVGGAGGWVLGAAMMSHGGKRGGKWTRRMMNVLGGWVLVFAPVLGGVVAVAPDRERWIGAGVTCAMVLSALLWALEMWKKPRTRSQAQPQSPSEQVPATHHGDIPKLGFWPVLLLSFGSAAFIGGLSFGGLPASPFTYLPCFSNTNTIPIPLSWTIIRTLLTVGSTFLLLGLALYIHTHSVSTVLPKLLIPISTSLTISSITLLLHFPTLTIPSLSCASWDWTLLIPLLGVLLSPLFDMHHTRYATKTMMTISRLVVLVAGATVLLVSSPTAISTTTGSEVGPLIGLFCVAICVRVATGPKRDAGTGGVTVVSGILLGTAMARCVVGMYTYLHRNNNNNKSDGEMLVIIPQALRVLHGVGLGLAGLAACVYLLSHFTDRIRKQHPLPDRNLSSIA